MKINMKEYNLKSLREKDIYTWEELIDIIQNLEDTIEYQQEEIENLKQDIEDNYKPISREEEIDWNERW